jgi:hypothetical protein
MRWLSAALLAAAVFALPASAARIDPRLLVLHQVDVPARYVFDEDNSLLFTRAMVDSGRDDGARALARAGFVNGYFARYANYGPPHWSYVNSGAYAFRQPKGARTYLLRMKAEFAKRSVRPQRLGLGDEGWLFMVSTSTDTGTSVLWRHGRVIAWVSCLEMTRHRSLALAQARKQERRIAAQVS